jgi:hypothetical protein
MAFAITGFGSLNFITTGSKGPTSTTEGLFVPFPTSFSVEKTTEKVDKFAFVPAGGTGVKQKVASFQAQQDWTGEMTFGVQSWLDLQFLYGQKAQRASTTTPRVETSIVPLSNPYTITDTSLSGKTATQVVVTWADYDSVAGSPLQLRVITTAIGVHAINAVASLGAASIVVDNGSGAAAVVLVVGDQITIAGGTSVYTITSVTAGTNEHTYGITPVLDDAKADADVVTVRSVVSLDNSGNTLTLPAIYAGLQIFYSIDTTEIKSVIGLTNPTLFTGFEFFGVLNTHGSSTRAGLGIYIPELILDGNFSVGVTGGDEEITVPFTPILKSGYSEPVVMIEL